MFPVFTNIGSSFNRPTKSDRLLSATIEYFAFVTLDLLKSVEHKIEQPLAFVFVTTVVFLVHTVSFFELFMMCLKNGRSKVSCSCFKE